MSIPAIAQNRADKTTPTTAHTNRSVEVFRARLSQNTPPMEHGTETITATSMTPAMKSAGLKRPGHGAQASATVIACGNTSSIIPRKNRMVGGGAGYQSIPFPHSGHTRHPAGSNPVSK
jgi:hypothetical protein